MSTSGILFLTVLAAQHSLCLPQLFNQSLNNKGFLKSSYESFIIAFMFGFIELYTFCLGSGNGLISPDHFSCNCSFWRTDIGIKPLQGAFVIWGSFLLTGGATFLASFHPAIGVFVNFASIYIILTLTSHQPMAKAYYPILSCYLFAKSSPVYGIDYGLRMIGIAGGRAHCRNYLLYASSQSKKKT